MTPALLLCAVLSVSDGDTFRADCGPVERIRLADIDAPETDGCGPGDAATAHLAWLLRGGRVEIAPLYRDRWGRLVAEASADGRDVAAEMLAAGLARPWPHDDAGRATAPRPDWCMEEL